MTPTRSGQLAGWLVILAVSVASLARAAEEGPWVRPDGTAGSEPMWGHREGLRIGLAPLPGPRGLIRIYAPYLGQPPRRVINFVAVEPIVAGRRCLSEIEPSAHDGKPGRRMLAADGREPPGEDASARPARGRIAMVDGVATLSVTIHVEELSNGARPIVEAVFRADRPHEVALRVHSAEGGAKMEACVLTATMGNYARLRHLWLGDGPVTAAATWPEFVPDGWGFSPWREWPAARLARRDDDILVAATGDEADPAAAEYDPSVGRGWRYQGRPATQWWRCRADESPRLRVNGRRTYWASAAPIPGGVSFENFELLAPFRPGQEFRFGVVPGGPGSLGFGPVAPPG